MQEIFPAAGVGLPVQGRLALAALEAGLQAVLRSDRYWRNDRSVEARMLKRRKRRAPVIIRRHMRAFCAGIIYWQFSVAMRAVHGV